MLTGHQNATGVPIEKRPENAVFFALFATSRTPTAELTPRGGLTPAVALSK
jgi:hypothetical protein